MPKKKLVQVWKKRNGKLVAEWKKLKQEEAAVTRVDSPDSKR